MPSNVLLEQSFTEAAKTFVADTSSFKENLYPLVKSTLDTNKGKLAYKKCIADFIEKRSIQLYDTIPMNRILFSSEDVNNLFSALSLDISVAKRAVEKTYYGEEEHFSPLSAKDPFTVTMLCVIKYFIEKNMNKESELAAIHLAFSGKFYPSLHYKYFRYIPPRHEMEYMLNNELSNKFDLVTEGNIIGCIRKIVNTWLKTYKQRFKVFTDEDVVRVINQLYSRINSFLKNIYRVFDKVHAAGNYMAYSSDSMDADNYHLSNSDLNKMNVALEKTVNYINSTGVDYTLCKKCTDNDENITVNEMKSIIESIYADPENMPKVKELLALMIVTYLQQAKPSEKDVSNVAFLIYCLAPKPNAKQKEIIRQKEIIEELLISNSKVYIRRRSRLATKNSYEKVMRMYFGLSVHNANR